ncbi:MAG: hypothetical protein ACJAT3_001875 [Akkermansiaceae bacterium]|jgi:hypothetical protein
MTESGAVFILGEKMKVSVIGPKEIFDGTGDFLTRPIGGNENAPGVDVSEHGTSLSKDHRDSVHTLIKTKKCANSQGER